jgi:hypothetical protein
MRSSGEIWMGNKYAEPQSAREVTANYPDAIFSPKAAGTLRNLSLSFVLAE